MLIQESHDKSKSSDSSSSASQQNSNNSPSSKAAPQKSSSSPLQLLDVSKWYQVVKYASNLLKDSVIGKKGFEERARRNPRDVVSKFFSLVWPDASDKSGSAELFLLAFLGLCKVYLLAKSASLAPAISRVVQSGDRKGFKHVGKRALVVAFLGAMTSSLSAWAESSLAIRWREKMTRSIHAKYFECMNYYALGNIAGKGAIVDPEERLAREVYSGTKRLAKIMTLLTRSIPSLFYFTYRLYKMKGASYALVPLLYYGMAYEIAQRLFPKNIGELYRAQAASVGAFYRSVTRTQTHGEAIAALGGSSVEKVQVLAKFGAVSGAARSVFNATSKFGLIFKMAYLYLPRAFMSAMVQYPSLALEAPVSMSAIGSELGGFREVGSVLLEMLVANGDLLTMSSQAEHMAKVSYRVTSLYETLAKLTEFHGKRQLASFSEGDKIEFDHVQIQTPTGIELVKDLSFEVPSKGKFLLTGQNGAGKSSIFRCLGGLWSSKGHITKPDAAEIFYLPQKPYNVLGTLAEQLTYPFGDSKMTEETMTALLKDVDLDHLLQTKRTEVINWEERLSLGESQRLAMARLFWHKPKFAVIDEATSALSRAMEDKLYLTCQELGIAYITICHRPALRRFHDTNLNLTGDGKGGWEIKSIDREAEMQKEAKRPSRAEKSVLKFGSEEEKVEGFLEKRSAKYAYLKKKKEVPKRNFFSQLVAISKIVLPGSVAKVALLLGAIGLRTVAHEGYNRANGALLGATLKRDRDGFFKALMVHFGIDVCTALIEEFCTYCQNEVSVVWTENLTRHAVNLFFRDSAYYNARLDKRIMDPDARITQEVSELAQSLSSIFALSLSPLFDVTYFGYSLYRDLGTSGTSPLLAYGGIASALLAICSPNHKFLNIREKELEAEYRFIQTRLKVHGESIAFLGGGEREREIADEKLSKLVAHLHKKNNANSLFKCLMFSIYKDLDSYSGIVTTPHLVIAYMQLLRARSSSFQDVATANARVSVSSERVLGAAGKLTSLFESFSSVISSSSRVVSMFDVFQEMHESGDFSDSRMDGQIDCKEVKVQHIDIVTPSGICLVADLSFNVAPKASVCLTGMNSSGKSSLFRVLSNLWPIYGDHAKIVRPPRAQLRLVPQKPYSYDGTLADLVTYPSIIDSDTERVQQALNAAGIGYLSERFPQGLNAKMRWEDTLSLGEQQRVQFARLYYARPMFCVLDECSDAVSVDQEISLYSKLNEYGITCITISKRLALDEFHEYQLSFGEDNENGWSITKIEKSTTRLSE